MTFTQSFGKLIRTRSSFAFAVDAFEAGDDIHGPHAPDKGRYSLRVPVAAARERYAADDPVFEQDVDLPRAGARAEVGYFLFHFVLFRKAVSKITIIRRFITD